MTSLGLAAGDPDVADVAGGAVGAAVDRAVDDDPAADPGADLDEEQVVDLAPVGPVLAQRHDVDVVVDQHRDAVAVGEALGDRVAVPAGHDRRVARAPGRVLDRPGDADADPAHVAVARGRPRAAGRGSARRPSRAPPRDRARSRSRRSPRRAPSPPRLVTARRAWVAPRSAASTTPASSLKANVIGGRPPVESLSPASRSRPCARSWSSRWATVERASPVLALRGRRGWRRRRRGSAAARPGAERRRRIGDRRSAIGGQ